MPTIITHAAVPLALGIGLGERVVPRPLLVVGIIASMLPDLDVIGFGFRVEYGSQFGHRGFTHSLFFALAAVLAGSFACKTLQATFAKTITFLFVAMASHGILDSFTNGGLGIALLWPFSTERYFAPVQVIEVSPIGLARFLSARGVAVIASEAIWVWLPCIALGAVLWAYRRGQTDRLTEAG